MTMGIGRDKKWWSLEDQDAGPCTNAEVAQYKELQTKFIMNAGKCHAVLCCRVSPKQKADVTRLVKEVLGQITLGIGDGANDVGMILEADVGVGIQGVEGSQAVNNADFALTQFQHLSNLMFVHGRWTYQRLSRAIVYFFYKNMIPTITIAFYIIASGFSGSGLYNDMVISGYNLVFTSFPVVVFALMEQDVEYHLSIQEPTMYGVGQHSERLNAKIFGLWMGDSLAASVFCFVPCWFAQHGEMNGRILGLGQVALTMYTCILLVVTFRLALDTQYWTWIHHVAYWGSIALWVLFIMLECAAPSGIVTDGTLYWDIYNVMGSAYFWLLLPLVTVASCLPAYVYRAYHNLYSPNVVEKVRQKIATSREDKLVERRATLDRIASSPYSSGEGGPSPMQPWKPSNFDRKPSNFDRETNVIWALQRRATVDGSEISLGAHKNVLRFSSNLKSKMKMKGKRNKTRSTEDIVNVNV